MFWVLYSCIYFTGYPVKNHPSLGGHYGNCFLKDYFQWIKYISCLWGLLFLVLTGVWSKYLLLNGRELIDFPCFVLYCSFILACTGLSSDGHRTPLFLYNAEATEYGIHEKTCYTTKSLPQLLFGNTIVLGPGSWSPWNQWFSQESILRIFIVVWRWLIEVALIIPEK